MKQLDLLSAPTEIVTASIAPKLERSTNPLQSVDAALQRIFTSAQEETRIDKARKIMGASVIGLADEELEVYLTEFQHLIDEWLDDFERQIFDGATLKQILGQG